MTLKPGDTLFNGQYHILQQLGRGGFGSVYQAEDTLLHDEVAIKELIPALVGDEAMLKRFLAEAKATMRLTHKRIVRTHNVFSEGGNYYIVMECMVGDSLETRLQQRGPLPAGEAVRIAAEICEGLSYAHEEGVVHCDLKPANILFTADGGAKIADFGIAHVSEQMLTRTWLTPAGFVAGTLPYMSPEQADGVRDDPRVDIYAVGAVLYRILTGRPYLEFDQRETPGAQADNVNRIRNAQPTPPSTHKRRVPLWLDALVLKALAKRPEDRYANADELRAALVWERAETVLAPVPPQPRTVPAPSLATPVSPPTHLRRVPLPLWSWPMVVGSAALVVAIVIITVVLMGGGGGDGETATPIATTSVVAQATPRSPTSTPRPINTKVLTPTPRQTDTSVPPTLTPRPTNTPVPLTPITIPTETEMPILTPMPTDTPAPLAHTTAPRPTEAPGPATRTPESTDLTPSAGDTWTRPADGAEMVYVPAGEFLMGSTDDDPYTNEEEKPQRTVYLDAFWIDKAEVTNAQYRKCVEVGACEEPGCWDDERYNAPNQPVVCVNWNDAQDYAAWVGGRLPTEAEWEKAARGSDGRIYPWGNSAPDCSKANYTGCAGRLLAVGFHPDGASPYGALDMAGNVWEWAADRYDGDYYARSPDRNPQGPDSGALRVVRGGSFDLSELLVRCAFRGWHSPFSRVSDVGLRVVVAPR